MLFQQVAKTQNRVLVVVGGAAQVNARKTPQHGRLIQRILGARIGEIKPLLQKVDAQHDRKTNRLTAVAGLRVVRPDQRFQLRYGTTTSITLKNSSRRLFRTYFSKLAWLANVI
jgi:hypothetical protein